MKLKVGDYLYEPLSENNGEVINISNHPDGKLVNISVETESELTMGNTAVDFWHVTDRPHNATWMHTANADGFYDLLCERLSRFSDVP